MISFTNQADFKHPQGTNLEVMLICRVTKPNTLLGIPNYLWS